MRYGRLRVTTPDGQVREHPLDIPAVTIGRSPENSIVIDHVTVARRHARVTIDSGMPLIEDLGSETGVYVDGQRLDAGQQHLFANRTIRIGDAEVAYLAPDSGGTPALSSGPTVAGAGNGTPGQPLAVTLLGPTAAVQAGSLSTATVQVQNRGSTVDEVTLQVLDLPAGWVEVSRTVVPLLPGARDDVTVTFRPPRSPDATAGDHSFSVAVNSRATGAEVRVVGVLALEPYSGVNLVMQPVRADRNFGITLENTGNAPLSMALTAQDDEGSLRFDFAETSIELTPGQRKNVRLRARMASAPKFGAEVIKSFRVEARQHGGSASATASGQLRVKPALEAWKFPVLALVVVAALAGGGVTYTARCESWGLPGCRDSAGAGPTGPDATVESTGTADGGGGGTPTMGPGGESPTAMPTTDVSPSAVTTETTSTTTSGGTPPPTTPVTTVTAEVTRFTAADRVLEPGRDYVAIVSTSAGDFTIDLDTKDAYATSNSFAFLGTKGFYNGMRFVTPGGTVSHGDPDGSGSAGYTQPADFTGAKNLRGTVGMIPVQPERDSVGSHWYVNLRDNALYDTGGFTGADIRPVFGTVTSGLDVLDRLTDEDTVTDFEVRQVIVDPFPTRRIPLPFPTLRPIFVP